MPKVKRVTAEHADGLGALSKLVPAAGREATAAAGPGSAEEAYPADAKTDRVSV